MAGEYVKGALEVADGVWAYLQPDGSWGWSNAGLVCGPESSLLVDTLFDLDLTREMIDVLARQATPDAPISTVVNTHANGDHCYGNWLVRDAEIVASKACAAEMAKSPPSEMAATMAGVDEAGEVGAFLKAIFGAFNFDGIEAALPSRVFEGELELKVGDRTVKLIEVGPAHTGGDVIVYLPDERVVFTGDIVFHGGHPIIWAGPVANWIAACERVAALGPSVVVPGHGPLAGPEVLDDLIGYFRWLFEEARVRFEAGMTAPDAAADIGTGPYSGWTDSERMAVNVRAVYRDLGATLEMRRGNSGSVFAAMSDLYWRSRR
jgi:glyoxylase-like metal-dependent hydrolase (beta-lactamase superfamily II)